MSGVLSHHLHLHLHSVVVFFPVAAVVVFVVAAVAILVVGENEGNKLVQYASTIMIESQWAKSIYIVDTAGNNVQNAFTL